MDLDVWYPDYYRLIRSWNILLFTVKHGFSGVFRAGTFSSLPTIHCFTLLFFLVSGSKLLFCNTCHVRPAVLREDSTQNFGPPGWGLCGSPVVTPRKHNTHTHSLSLSHTRALTHTHTHTHTHKLERKLEIFFVYEDAGGPSEDSNEAEGSGETKRGQKEEEKVRQFMFAAGFMLWFNNFVTSNKCCHQLYSNPSKFFLLGSGRRETAFLGYFLLNNGLPSRRSEKWCGDLYDTKRPLCL